MSDESSDREITAAEFMDEMETRKMALMVIRDFRKNDRPLNKVSSLEEINSIL